MKAVRAEAMKVKCDSCSWKLPLDSLEAALEWHNKPCPECGHASIINDHEKALLEAMAATISDLNNMLGEVKDINDAIKIEISVDTARGVK